MRPATPGPRLAAAPARQEVDPRSGSRRTCRSDLEKLCLFALEGLVDGIDGLAGQSVELLLAARDLVLTDLGLERIQLVLRLAADATHLHLRVLRLRAHELDVLLAALH